MTAYKKAKYFSSALLALGLAAMSAVAGAAPASFVIEQVSHYRAGSSEAMAIAHWLDNMPDAERRVMDLGVLTVSHRKVGNGALAVSAAAPPVALPPAGAPGERYTITNELPGGFIETWTFQWVAGDGGGWKQTDYEQHAPIVEPERPQEL
ncbi:hypothetical protein C1922_01345 [Stenotrophomonas sp. ZAC14D2_NAIMI4_7]|nr:hypothetical protein C1922_01345 [Stenotrophomonas sp. ZAC14D2_NAIMI4_7]